jgi:hypothetical protein
VALICNDFEATYKLLKDKLSWEYIDVLNFSTQYLEKNLEQLDLDVMGKLRSDYIEDMINPPSMVCYFYYYLYIHKRIPNQKEYFDFYYLTNSKWIEENIGLEYDIAFKGRLSRFFPSMIRDFHFYHLLKESERFKKVLYVLKYDLDSKVDIFLKSDLQWYGIQLRTNTSRSARYFQKKPRRNMVNMKTKLIDIPLNLKTARSIITKGNDLKLYGKDHIHKILNEIIRYESNM